MWWHYMRYLCTVWLSAFSFFVYCLLSFTCLTLMFDFKPALWALCFFLSVTALIIIIIYYIKTSTTKKARLEAFELISNADMSATKGDVTHSSRSDIPAEWMSPELSGSMAKFPKARAARFKTVSSATFFFRMSTTMGIFQIWVMIKIA